MPDGSSETTEQNSNLAEARKYWVGQLSGHRGVSSLKPDYPRPGGYCYEKDVVEIRLNASTYRELDGLTADSPVLLHATLMAALTILLHKCSGESSVVVGSPARRYDGSDRANALVIVDRVDHQHSFR